jgi:hypothetical protein
MLSLVALILVLSLVAWIRLPGPAWPSDFGLGLRRVESRLRALWIWRHGRERARVRGVIHC